MNVSLKVEQRTVSRYLSKVVKSVSSCYSLSFNEVERWTCGYPSLHLRTPANYGTDVDTVPQAELVSYDSDTVPQGGLLPSDTDTVPQG